MKKPIMWTAAILALLIFIGVSTDESTDADVETTDVDPEVAWQAGPPESAYILVEHTLKRIAHDPGSVSVGSDACSRAGGNPDDGWIVTCRYRGTNALGATVLTSGDFRIIRVEGGYAALPE